MNSLVLSDVWGVEGGGDALRLPRLVSSLVNRFKKNDFIKFISAPMCEIRSIVYRLSIFTGHSQKKKKKK